MSNSRCIVLTATESREVDVNLFKFSELHVNDVFVAGTTKGYLGPEFLQDGRLIPYIKVSEVCARKLGDRVVISADKMFGIKFYKLML